MSKNQIFTKSQWIKKIELWNQSGQSARAWCRENQLIYTTFMGWRKRLKLNLLPTPSPNLVKTQFKELKNVLQKPPEISLEYDGILIHLQAEFDAALLKRCLAVLRGASC